MAPAEPRPLIVAKIGGSLHASADLPRWIAALKQYPHRLTLVCGGGPFADAVRAAQPKMGFSDETAHAMALLAMEQYALALAGLFDLDLAASCEEIDAAHAQGRIALWRPATMVAAANDIAPGWDVTSDSLAAWLAGETGASALLLIKSVDVGGEGDRMKDCFPYPHAEEAPKEPSRSARVRSRRPLRGLLRMRKPFTQLPHRICVGVDLALRNLVTAGVVDPAFPTYVDGTPVFVAGPQALAHAARLLAGGALPGAPVVSSKQKIAS